ncbi:hypothetical protein TNIN_307961 [Trichonephila inaurata madagascariensis]|uniref:Uncharacterized protein n=1 Tax=Trichonephila inaurata madagascariensis TaxID=2747483 RepID=A0A8X6XS17_9ARAC|nr:hypothetical protein TNIN_307961 [Trichonephila inaurata madagascariensis]
MVLPAGVFDSFTSLESLKLDKNFFTFIPNAVLFAPLPNLKVLSFDENACLRIREDMTSSETFHKIQHLNISHSNITVIASHDFLMFPDLLTLILRDNLIAKVSPGAFKPLTHLVELDFGYNELDILPKNDSSV